MADLHDKTRNALNEARILVLAGQVIVGFQFQSAFQPGFGRLAQQVQALRGATLGVLLVALGLLLWPASYHRIVERGENSGRFHRFTTSVISVALFPFALSLGGDFFIVSGKLFGTAGGAALGIFMGLLALFFWFFIEAGRRRRGRPAEAGDTADRGATTLNDKIEEVLIEARMVLPGAQALLGFQFTIVLMDRFEDLPSSLRILHVGSLVVTAVSIVLLMATAAYHRLVARGEDTEDVFRIGGRFVLGAMVFLALGMSGDFSIVIWQISKSAALAGAAGAGLLGLFYGLWFGYTALRASRCGPSGGLP